MIVFGGVRFGLFFEFVGCMIIWDISGCIFTFYGVPYYYRVYDFQDLFLSSAGCMFIRVGV